MIYLICFILVVAPDWTLIFVVVDKNTFKTCKENFANILETSENLKNIWKSLKIKKKKNYSKVGIEPRTFGLVAQTLTHMTNWALDNHRVNRMILWKQ